MRGLDPRIHLLGEKNCGESAKAFAKNRWTRESSLGQAAGGICESAVLNQLTGKRTGEQEAPAVPQWLGLSSCGCLKVFCATSAGTVSDRK